MSTARAVFNATHALGWTAFMCSVGVGVYSVTGSEPAFQYLNRVWVEGLVRGMGIRVRAYGTEHLAPDGTYVFVANHLSHLDILALFAAIPMRIGFLSKQELRRVPFLGPAMVAGGHVFVDRQRHANAMRAMMAAADDVRAGKSLVVFPEGTRGKQDEIQPFKRGGFHLAVQAGVPIVPVGLRGTRALMGRDDILPRSGSVEVHIGAPIDPETFGGVAELVGRVRAKVAELAAMPLA